MCNFMSPRRGSAYLLAITIVSILVIMAMVFGSSKTARRWTTRLQSDETKAEALANSAIELALREVKDKMNKEDDPTWYIKFRLPAKVKTGLLLPDSLGTGTGEDAELDLSNENNWKAEIFKRETSEVIQQLDSVITGLGGTDHVTLDLKAQVVYAGAITAKRADYPVAGISVKAKTSSADEAKFFDSIGNPALGMVGVKDKFIGNYLADFALPNYTVAQNPPPGVPNHSDSHEIDYPLDWLHELNVNLKKTGICMGSYEVPDVIDETPFDLNEMFRKYIGTTDPNITIESFLKLAIKMPTDNGLTYQAVNFRGAARTRYESSSEVAPFKDAALALGDLFGPPVVMEKSGILRITADVEYKPQGPTGKVIKRTLIADKEFKVSDIHPPAPEYSLFIANSTLLCEPPDPIQNGSEQLADAINWNGGVATFAVHSVPLEAGTGSASYELCTGLNNTSDGNFLLPGLVRINSSQRMKMNTFLGTLDEPTSSELPVLFTETFGTPHFGVFSFQWSDRSPSRKFDFAVARNSSLNTMVRGIKNLKTILDFCDALAAPTLLHGNAFAEHSLAIRPEAFLDKKFSTLDVTVHPKASMSEDKTQIYIDYQVKTEPYGFNGLPTYPTGTANSPWHPLTAANMPPNVYSALQYAKKADNFYETEEAFWNHTDRFGGAKYDCSGVTYIKSDLHINSANLNTAGLGSEFLVTGQGILVVKGSVIVDKNIVRETGGTKDTVFSLIARLGCLQVDAGCNLIEASVYSHLSPKNTTGNKLIINGNLVTNQFIRDDTDSIQVQYNSKACRITPLSVMRDVGKLEPKRYIVSMGKRWSRFEFLKQ